MKQGVIYHNIVYRKKHVFKLLWALIFLGTAMFIAYFGYRIIEVDIQIFGPAIFWKSGKYYFITFFTFVLLFFIQLIRSIPPQKKEVTIDENEIIIKTGRNVINVKWEEIERIWLNFTRSKILWIPIGELQLIKLESDKGKTLKLDSNVQPFNDLLQDIRYKFHKSFLKNNIQHLNNSTFDFGAIKINEAKTLIIGKKLYAISEICDIRLNKGYLILTFEINETKRKIPIHKLSNFDSFLWILKYLGVKL